MCIFFVTEIYPNTAVILQVTAAPVLKNKFHVYFILPMRIKKSFLKEKGWGIGGGWDTLSY